MEEREVDFKFFFPNLIIFLGPNKKDKMLNQLKKSFTEFQYGPIFTHAGTSVKHGSQISTFRIMQGSGIRLCLAEGEGPLPCDAEQQAVEKLFKKLCDSCYVIQANPDYYAKKKVPPYALSVDPLYSHVYKVVYLKKNSRGVPFPLPVDGAVDYVENFEELLEYIEAHAKSDTKADLFILNVLKSDRASIRQVVQTNGMTMSHLVGCSDMGIHAYRNMSTRAILQDLLQYGGETVKYKLIGPRDQFGGNEVKDEIKSEAAQVEDLTKEEEELVINPWIADRLVLMEVVDEYNELECSREIIWRSVRDCPDTQEFIIEKKRNTVSMIHAEAMIDRNVVGRARGFCEKRVKGDAAEDAMRNLMKCCHYIEAKKSYFGSSKEMPAFLKKQNPVPTTKIYRIAEKSGTPPHQILKQFKGAWQEDLYFRWDFKKPERIEIQNLAKKMGFLVRWVKDCLCVYKKRKPKDVFMELMATHSKENEKYKLVIPPAKFHQQTQRSTTQDWDNQRPHDDTQANTPATFSRHAVYNDSPAVSDTQASHSAWQHHTSHVDHGGSSQACSQEDNTETPNWVMKFIQSAPLKPEKPLAYTMSRPAPSQRQGDDVGPRYNLTPPIPKPPSVPSSNVNSHVAGQRQDQHFMRDNVETCKEKYDHQNDVPANKSLDHKSTLSERLQTFLEEYNKTNSLDQTNLGSNQAEGHLGNKRPSDRGPSLKEEWEPSNKLHKPSTNSQSSQFSKSAAYQNSKEREEFLNNFYGPQVGGTSDSSVRTWEGSYNKRESEGRYSNCQDKSYTEDSNFVVNDFSTTNVHTTGVQRRNPYDESSRVKVEEESLEDTSKSFDTRPESSQSATPLWDKGIKQQYDQRYNTSAGGQRNISNLFDYSGPQDIESQGSSRSLPSTKPLPPWIKNPRSKGHSFSKLAKYGKRKGDKRPY